ATSSQIVKALPANSGISITSPPDNTVLTADVHLAATAASNSPITVISVADGSRAVFTSFQNSIDHHVRLANGAHTLTVTATDSSGVQYTSSVNVTVQVPDQAPTAAITLTPGLAGNPLQLLACTAQ